MLGFTTEEQLAAQHEFAGDRPAKTKLDVAIVLDTTGSMGDELEYLRTELAAISQTVSERFPNSDQRWSLVVYRDRDDGYLVRHADFSPGAETTRANLGRESADGGGDYPEAPDAAFETLNLLSWRADADTARLAFWVADAPHHTGKAVAMRDAIRATRSKGIHVYPVAASGANDLLELTMRNAAQLTGGRYLFLTDDSGVGDSS